MFFLKVVVENGKIVSRQIPYEWQANKNSLTALFCANLKTDSINIFSYKDQIEFIYNAEEDRKNIGQPKFRLFLPTLDQNDFSYFDITGEFFIAKKQGEDFVGFKNIEEMKELLNGIKIARKKVPFFGGVLS